MNNYISVYRVPLIAVNSVNRKYYKYRKSIMRGNRHDIINQIKEDRKCCLFFTYDW